MIFSSLTQGYFQEVLDDSQVNSEEVRTLTFCSGRFFIKLSDVLRFVPMMGCMSLKTSTAIMHTNHGDIKIDLFGNHAPKTVENFDDYTQCINKVVAYINNHLEESLDLKTLAEVAIYIKEKQLKTL